MPHHILWVKCGQDKTLFFLESNSFTVYDHKKPTHQRVLCNINDHLELQHRILCK